MDNSCYNLIVLVNDHYTRWSKFIDEILLVKYFDEFDMAIENKKFKKLFEKS